MSLEDTKNIYDETGEQFSPVIGIDAIKTADGTSLLDLIHPVGEYYETSNTSFDPNVSWGGTWVKDTAGKVMIAQTEGGEFPTLGAEVGSSSVTIQAHTHTIPAHNHGGNTGSTTLTTAMIPGHTHSFSATTEKSNVNTSSAGSHTHNVSITSRSTSPSASTGIRSLATYSNSGSQYDIMGNMGNKTPNSNISYQDLTWSGYHAVVSAHPDVNVNNPHVYKITISMPHTHSVAGNTSSAEGHTHTLNDHTHSVSGTTGSAGSGNGHNHTITSQAQTNTGSAGETTISTIQPSVVCIRWHRIA